MSDLFKIKDVVRVDYYDAGGNAWGREVDARASNAEIAMTQVLGKDLISAKSNFNTVRLLSRVPADDIKVLRDLFDRYLDEVRPAFMALEGPFTYGTGRVIETADGQTFDDPEKASRHVLETLLTKLFDSDAISSYAKRMITNASVHVPPDHPTVVAQVRAFRFVWAFRDLINLTSDLAPYGYLPGQEERLAKALHIAWRTLHEPVPPKLRAPR